MNRLRTQLHRPIPLLIKLLILRFDRQQGLKIPGKGVAPDDLADPAGAHDAVAECRVPGLEDDEFPVVDCEVGGVGVVEWDADGAVQGVLLFLPRGGDGDDFEAGRALSRGRRVGLGVLLGVGYGGLIMVRRGRWR